MYLISARTSGIKKIEDAMKSNKNSTLRLEVDKIENDNKTYKLAKVIWVGLSFICALSSLLLNTEFFRGLALGFTVLFIGLFIIDSFLHK